MLIRANLRLKGGQSIQGRVQWKKFGSKNHLSQPSSGFAGAGESRRWRSRSWWCRQWTLGWAGAQYFALRIVSLGKIRQSALRERIGRLGNVPNPMGESPVNSCSMTHPPNLNGEVEYDRQLGVKTYLGQVGPNARAKDHCRYQRHEQAEAAEGCDRRELLNVDVRTGRSR